jgi:hypothetical protein
MQLQIFVTLGTVYYIVSYLSQVLHLSNPSHLSHIASVNSTKVCIAQQKDCIGALCITKMTLLDYSTPESQS